jgi:hypothetical protein
MTWLTWRQYRTQLLVVFGVLGAIAIALGITGPHLVHIYDTSIANCSKLNDCNGAQISFTKMDGVLKALWPAMLIVPALIGIFWGAPLVARELETGSFRLAWTQSVSRTRWMVIRLVLVGLAAVAVAGLLSLMVTWWSAPFDRLAGNTMSPSHFDRRDLVPVGYAAYAFALGVTAGIVIRRTLPAMAVTLVGFIATRFAVLFWVRPNFMAPLKTVSRLNPFSPDGPGAHLAGPNSSAWIISAQTIDKSGQVIGTNGGLGPNGQFNLNVSNNGTLNLGDGRVCPNRVTPPKLSGGNGGSIRGLPTSINRGFLECIDKLDIRQVVTYQPANRYWPFQIDETLLYVVLALLLSGFCVWWVRRRLA